MCKIGIAARSIFIAAIGTFAAVLIVSNPAPAEELRIGGTGAATAMLQYVGSAFAAQEDGAVLKVIPSLGGRGALRALVSGALDVGVTSGPVVADDSEQGLSQVLTLRTPYGLVTSQPTPNGLKSTEIAGIFRSGTSTWDDGTPIRIILRPKADSSSGLLGAMFPGMADGLEQAHRRPEVPVGATDQDAADLAEHIRGSLTGTALTLVLMEKRDLRFVAIDGALPSLANMENGKYPYQAPFHFVLPVEPTPAAARLIAYLRSPEGIRTLREAGFVPLQNGR